MPILLSGLASLLIFFLLIHSSSTTKAQSVTLSIFIKVFHICLVDLLSYCS